MIFSIRMKSARLSKSCFLFFGYRFGKCTVRILTMPLAILLFSCNESNDQPEPYNTGICDHFNAPAVSYSGAANIGQNVTLFANTNLQDVTFSWTGPNQFSSVLQNPVISNIQYKQSGQYHASIKNSSCTSPTAAVTVVVNTGCGSIVQNTAQVGTATWQFYSNVQCGPQGANLYHAAWGTTASETLTIQFNKPAAPVGYAVYGVTTNPGIDSTLVSITLNDGGTAYFAQSGSLFAGNDGNGTSYIFCNINFQSAGGINKTGKANMRCN